VDVYVEMLKTKQGKASPYGSNLGQRERLPSENKRKHEEMVEETEAETEVPISKEKAARTSELW
jgi:hypothetical protein